MSVKRTFLELEIAIFKEINSKFVELGLEKGWYSIHSLKVNWIYGKVELTGYDKMKGDDFEIIYDYDLKDGTLIYLNDSYQTRISNI